MAPRKTKPAAKKRATSKAAERKIDKRTKAATTKKRKAR